MALYEFRVEHKPAGGRVSQINDRLVTLAAEGWEPIMMCGGEELNILLRRPASELPTAVTAEAEAAVPAEA